MSESQLEGERNTICVSVTNLLATPPCVNLTPVSFLCQGMLFECVVWLRLRCVRESWAKRENKKKIDLTSTADFVVSFDSTA